jgi:hypothetical protein
MMRALDAASKLFDNIGRNAGCNAGCNKRGSPAEKNTPSL